MTCPLCGSKMKVYCTRQAGSCIIRYRRCPKCGQTSKTVEETPE